MGLGILLFGYVFVALFTFSPVYFVTDLVGAYLIFVALGKLRRHAPRFKYAVVSNYAYFIIAAVQCVYTSVKVIGLYDGTELFDHALEICRLAALFILTVSVLLALSQLASSVGDEKLADKGKRNVYFFVLSYVLMIALSLDFEFMRDFKAAFSAFGLMFRILCALLNCVYIHSCYMWICLESDHDMDKLSAGDRFIGRIMPKKGNKDADDIDGADAAAEVKKPSKKAVPEPKSKPPIVHHKYKKK